MKGVGLPGAWRQAGTCSAALVGEPMWAAAVLSGSRSSRGLRTELQGWRGECWGQCLCQLGQGEDSWEHPPRAVRGGT